MDKLILVFYIDVGNLASEDIPDYMKNISKNMVDENIINYIIPVRTETRVECLNPKLVSLEDYTKAKKILEYNQDIVNKIIEQNGM
jgi:hypothetical protein